MRFSFLFLSFFPLCWVLFEVIEGRTGVLIDREERRHSAFDLIPFSVGM